MTTRRERAIQRALGNDRFQRGLPDGPTVASVVDAYEVELAADLQSPETVERMSAAIWQMANEKFPGYPYERLIDATKQDLRDYARAALKAAVNDE